MQERYELALRGAIVSKGARKGKLKKQCPPMGTDSSIVWQTLMLEINPFNVGIGHMMIGNMTDSEFFQYCQAMAKR